MFFIDDIEISTTTGINAVDASTFSLSPNPTKGLVRIQSADAVKELTVFDSVGKEVRRELVNASDKTVDLSSLKSGMYLIRLTTDKGIKVGKIIKN
jgi:hypothetical protein